MNKIDNLNNKKLNVSSLAVEQMSKILSFEKKGLLVTPAIYSKQLLPLIKSYLDVNVIKYKKF